MGTFFKIQWSYCGFHAGGIYEWGHFSNFSGATVVFMLVEYMNGDIFSNFSGATVVFMLVEYMNGDIFQTSVELLWFSCWWNI